MERIAEVLPRVMKELARRNGNGHNGNVVINTLDESPEVLLGLFAHGVESGLMVSAHDLTALRINGRNVPVSRLVS